MSMEKLVEQCLVDQKPTSCEGKILLRKEDGGVIETFTSLKLDTEKEDVYASLDKFVEGYTDVHGATVLRSFQELPTVLHLRLERKVNMRYGYPYQLDLDKENGKYLSPDAERSIPNLYTLYRVIVHNGQVEDETNYAIMRPTVTKFWNANALILMYRREDANDMFDPKRICELCPGRINPVDDLEDYGKASVSKRSPKVTKMPRK